MTKDIDRQASKLTGPAWLRDDELPGWDEFVRGHERGLPAHLTGWKRALEGAFPHVTGRVLVLKDGESGQIVAGLPVYVARSWFLGTRLLSVPFASLSDPLVRRSAHWELLAQGILQARDACRARYVQIAAMPGTKLLGRSPFGMRPQRHHYVPLDRPVDGVLARCSRMAVRHPIKKARQSGMKVVSGEDERLVADFHRLFVESRRRVALPAMPVSFFEGLLRHLGSGHAGLFMVYRESEALAGVVTTRMKDRMVLEYSGASGEGRRSGALHLAYWEAIRFAHEQGYLVCSFGRTSPRNTGLLAHKRHWGTVEEELPVFTDHVGGGDGVGSDSSWRARFVRGAIGLMPSWMYRRVGEYCYRHWA